jgi:hypothetical protein
MVVTPQTRPPALTCFNPSFPPVPFPLREKGTAVVVGNTVVGSSGKIVGVVNVAVGTTMWLVVLGTTAGVLISSPGTISGESKEDDGWVRREI